MLLLLFRAGGRTGAAEEEKSGLPALFSSEKTGEPGGERTESMRDLRGVMGGVTGAEISAETGAGLLRCVFVSDADDDEDDEDDDEDEDAVVAFGAPGSTSISSSCFSSLFSFVLSFFGVRLLGVFVLLGVVVVRVGFFFVGVFVLLLLALSFSFSSSFSSSAMSPNLDARFFSFSFSFSLSSVSTPCIISAMKKKQMN